MKKIVDWGELRRLMMLMVPLYLANLMQMGMGVIDTIVAGASSAQDLAAVALGSSVAAPIMVAFGVILSIIGPMISRLRGAGAEGKVGLLLNNAKLLAGTLAVAELAAMGAGSCVFCWVTDDALLADKARQYLYFIMLGIPANLVFRAMQGNFEGYGQPRPAMIMSLVGLLANIPLNYAFVFGWGPLPAMGGPGCGLTTSMIQWLMCLMMLALMFGSRQHRRHARQMWVHRAMEPAVCGRIFKLGLPIGVASLCEMSFFCVVTLVIAPLGELMVSAQQVAINVSGVIFMLPLSLGIATSIRAAYHIGAHHREAFNAMVRTVLATTYTLVCLLMLLTILLRRPIVELYTDSSVVIETAQVLLIYCAVYQISDATQALMAGLLRGCHDTAAITWVNLGCYWLVGFPLSVILIRTDWIVPAMGPAGAWVSFIIALTLTAIALAWRFSRTRRRLFPE